MITIREIDYVVFRVVDLERVLEFYTNVLGARLKRSVRDAGLYQLRAGTSLIDLVPVESQLGRMGGCGAS